METIEMKGKKKIGFNGVNEIIKVFKRVMKTNHKRVPSPTFPCQAI